MRFIDVNVAASQANSADPRANPDLVKDTLVVLLPKTIANTDTSPPYVGLVLEGTAADTIDVTLWAKFEPPGNDGFAAEETPANRCFYKIGVTTTLTVGTMKTLPAVPGPVYVQIANAPTHASILRLAPMAAPIP